MTCGSPNKVRYGHQGAAVSALDQLRARKPWRVPNLAPYRCGNHWHLGHHAGGLKWIGGKRGGR